jgi:hypothetical protein
MVDMKGPVSHEEICDILAVWPPESCGAFIVTHESVRLALERMGFWMMEQVDGLDGNEICSLVGSVGKLFVTACDGISRNRFRAR